MIANPVDVYFEVCQQIFCIQYLIPKLWSANHGAAAGILYAMMLCSMFKIISTQKIIHRIAARLLFASTATCRILAIGNSKKQAAKI